MLRTFRKQKKREKTVDTEILTKVFLIVNTQKKILHILYKHTHRNLKSQCQICKKESIC